MCSNALKDRFGKAKARSNPWGARASSAVQTEAAAETEVETEAAKTTYQTKYDAIKFDGNNDKMSRDEFELYVKDYKQMRRTGIFDPTKNKALNTMTLMESAINGRHVNWGPVTSTSYVYKLIYAKEAKLKESNRAAAAAALETGTGTGTGGMRGGSCFQTPPCNSDKCWDEACEIWADG
jgi:hypothetical protein